jgi:hypothetical protein
VNILKLISSPNTPIRKIALLMLIFTTPIAIFILHRDLDYSYDWHPSLLFILLSTFSLLFFAMTFTPLIAWVSKDNAKHKINPFIAELENELASWPKEQASIATQIIRQVLLGKDEFDIEELANELTAAQFRYLVRQVEKITGYPLDS